MAKTKIKDVDETTSTSILSSIGDIPHDLSIKETVRKEVDELLKKEKPKSSYDFLDIYKIIVDTRKFEIENFWRRALFFSTTIFLLLAGYFNVKNEDMYPYLLFVSYIGFFYTLIFSFSVRGSKYWQEHWEEMASIYEEQAKFRIYRWDSKNLIYKNSKDEFLTLRPWKHSVSKLTMILSDITLILWLCLVIKDFKYCINNSKLFFVIDTTLPISWFSVAAIGLPLIILFYFFVYQFFERYIKVKKQFGAWFLNLFKKKTTS